MLNRIGAVHRNAHWHLAHDKYGEGKRARANDKIINAELSQANVELKAIRNSRLKELYSQDWAS